MNAIPVRIGRASNGTPAFMVPGLSSELSRPFGATRSVEDGVWQYPAYFPVVDRVVEDLNALQMNFEFSEAALRHIASVKRTQAMYEALELPSGFSFVTTPFQHQILGLAHAFYMLRAAIFFAPGLGKSKIVVDWMRLLAFLGEPGMTVVIGPLVTIRNWGKEIDTHSGKTLRWGAMLGEPEDKHRVVDEAAAGAYDVLLVTYDTNRNYVDEIIAKVPYTRIAADECLLGSGQILTKKGLRTIADIVASSEPVFVLSSNLSSGELEWKPVTAKWRRPRKTAWCQVQHDAGTFTCTTNHQIWTEEAGYIAAAALTADHHLRMVPETLRDVSEGRCDGAVLLRSVRFTDALARPDISSSRVYATPPARDEVLSAVPKTISVSVERSQGGQGATFLRKLMRSSMADGAARTARAAARGDQDCASKGARRETARYGRTNAAGQSGLEAGGTRQDSQGTKGLHIPGARGERETDKTAIEVGESVGLADRGCGCNQKRENAVRIAATVVQSGCGAPQNENGGRSRWSYPQIKKVAVSGQAEDGGTQCTRVVGVTVLERGGVDGFSGSCEEDSFAYDLEVADNHNYFVNGVLVSNSHRIKNWGAARTAAAFELGQKAERKVILTGTPTLGNPEDLYGQFKFLAPYFMPENPRKYRERFFEMSPANRHLILGYKNLPILNRRTLLVSIRRTKEECLDLPEQLFVDVVFDLKRQSAVIYNELIDAMGINIDELTSWLRGMADEGGWKPLTTSGGQTYTVPQVAVLLNKLSQVRSGFLLTGNVDKHLCDDCEHLPFCVPAEIEPYTQDCYEVHAEPDPTLTTFDDNAALDALEELLDAILGDSANKVLIWCRYSWPGTEIDMICDMLEQKGIKHTRVGKGDGAKVFDLAEEFNADPTRRVYVAQAATGEGITLNSANYTIFFNFGYALQEYLQPLDRNHRIGQDRKVTVYRMMAANTVDASIVSLLAQKVEIDRYLTSPNIVVPRAVARRTIKAHRIGE